MHVSDQSVKLVNPGLFVKTVWSSNVQKPSIPPSSNFALKVCRLNVKPKMSPDLTIPCETKSRSVYFVDIRVEYEKKTENYE